MMILITAKRITRTVSKSTKHGHVCTQGVEKMPVQEVSSYFCPAHMLKANQHNPHLDSSARLHGQ